MAARLTKNTVTEVLARSASLEGDGSQIGEADLDS